MGIISYLLRPGRSIKRIRIDFFNFKINLRSEISGKSGLEIGGPSQIFTKDGLIPVYPFSESVDGCNFSNYTVWENEIQEGFTYKSGEQNLGRQFIKEASDLTGIQSDSYDFLLSSHSLEHIANPLRALTEWLRVLKSGGLVILVLPDKRFTFDHRRPHTTFDHLLNDFQNNIQENDLTHLDEIVELHDIRFDVYVKSKEEFVERSKKNFENRCLHHHVFSPSLLKEMFKYLNIELLVSDSLPQFHHIIIGKKP